MKMFKLISTYLSYFFKAKTKHGIHSPFVFDLVTKAFSSKYSFSEFKKIETIRLELQHNAQRIDFFEIGAGRQKNIIQKKIGDIALNSAKSKKYCFLLYNLINYFKPQTMLELGTSLGISAMYQAAANADGQLITLEGNKNVAEIAKLSFNRLNLTNINIQIGLFDDILPEILKNSPTLDYVFFDGNHRKDSTIKYFNQCLPIINNNTLFIFDDIHWSKEMEEAWEIIKSNNQVTTTIDIFFMGIVFFRKELSKENFVVRF